MTSNRRVFLSQGFCAVSVTFLGFSSVLDATAQVPPTVTGPLANTSGAALQVWDPSAQGYVAEEYIITGRADVFEAVSMADAVDMSKRDPVADQAPRDDYTRKTLAKQRPYATRIVVYRPADKRRFSGNVIMESFHPSGGGEMVVWTQLNADFMANGDAFIGVQHPVTFAGLRSSDPKRYGRLHAEDMTQIWKMIADVGELAKSTDRLAIRARRLYLTGYSFTGVVAATFASFHHHETRLANGKPVFDGYIPMASAMFVRPLDVPVIRMLNESDFNQFGGLGTRGSASPLYRIYELAGSSHVATPMPTANSARPPRPAKIAEGQGLPGFSPQSCFANFPKGSFPNDFPTRLAQAALFRNIFDWVDRGISPPPSALLSVDEGGFPTRDEYGNAQGGLRLPPILVPDSEFGMGRGNSCFLFGYRRKFAPEKMRALYGSKEEYVKRFKATADACIAQRIMTPRGGAELVATLSNLETF